MSLELQSLLPYPNSCLGASPHQQGRDTKMAMLSFGGIDVSKDRLDITVLPDEQCSSVSNDAAGWAELLEQRDTLRFSADCLPRFSTISYSITCPSLRELRPARSTAEI